MKKLSPSRVTKGILYLLIGGGTFLFFPQFTEDYVFVFLILFGSASAGVSAIYMSLGGSYLKSEEQGSRLLTLIVVLLFVSSIAGFLLVSYNILLTEPILGLGLQLMTPNVLILILAVIAVLFEIIIVITIQTKGLGELIPPDEAIPVEKDQNDLPPVPSPREDVTEGEEKEDAEKET